MTNNFIYNFNQSDYQNFVYLVLLLGFLLGGILLRRDFPWIKALKYLALWSLIALVIIGFYAYRFELADFKNRVIGEINPTKPQIEKDGALIINLSSDNHFYVDIVVNGILVRFMIDTGASDIVLSHLDARKVGINLRSLKFNKRYETANGKAFGASVILRQLEIGNAKFINVPASVNSADMGISLLGMSFLRQFKKYEFYQDKLILTL